LFPFADVQVKKKFSTFTLQAALHTSRQNAVSGSRRKKGFALAERKTFFFSISQIKREKTKKKICFLNHLSILVIS
jgi:hypothetical protein